MEHEVDLASTPVNQFLMFYFFFFLWLQAGRTAEEFFILAVRIHRLSVVRSVQN